MRRAFIERPMAVNRGINSIQGSRVTDVTNLVAANGKLYAETADGIMSSTDGGESWTLLPIGVDDITDIAEFDGNVYARGEKNRLARFFRLSADEDRLAFILGIPPFEKVTSDEQEWLNKINDPFQNAPY